MKELRKTAEAELMKTEHQEVIGLRPELNRFKAVLADVLAKHHA